MSKRMRAVALAFSLLVVGYVVAGSLLGRTIGEGAYNELAVFSEVLNRIQNNYVEEPNLNRVTVGALHGLLSELDPYSSYLSPREYEQYEQRTQKGGDVGLVLSKRQGWISVVTVLPNSPAAKADLRTGYILESIAGFATREMSVEQARMFLNGEPGTPVEIAVVRPQQTEPQPLELVRAQVATPQVLSDRLAPDVGYVKLAAFTEGTAEQVRGLLTDFQQAGADKLILDLRDAATGKVEEAVATAGLLLEQGVITYTEGQQQPRREWTADPATQAWDGPVTVLINRGTAGPAEIVAAAVLDHGRGEVVGQHSYGLGGVQKLITLEDGSALILTVAKHYTPAGRSIPDTGVAPSVEAEAPAGQAFQPVPHALPAPADPVLLKALEVLGAGQPARTDKAA